MQAILLEEGQQRISIVPKTIIFDGQGDNLRVNTAADNDGVRRLMSIPAKDQGSDPIWYVFALSNPTDKPITRWLVASRYNITGSGIIWPDLDSNRVRAITPSVGFVPQKVDNDVADIFQITIEPGQNVTYVAELEASRANIDLWSPVGYELYIRDRQLFNGIMLGITGLLGVFLTAVFAANHKMIFPSAALVTWSVLAYLCVDFGFWHKLLQLNSEDNAIHRAATEAAMASSLAIFLYTFLRLGAWHGFVRMLALVWIIAALSIVFVAFIDPRLASTFARLSFAGLGITGGLVIIFLAIKGQDRALSLVPTWLLFLVWLFGVTTTLNGQLSGDIVVSSLVAGLTLVVVLLGFTVTQFAFATRDLSYVSGSHGYSLQYLACNGAGAAVWDWNAKREIIKVSPTIEMILGLSYGELSNKVSNFLRYVHPDDKERLLLQMAFIQKNGNGIIRIDLRMRRADSSYRWFEIDAANITSSESRSLRCVGLMRDITDIKSVQDRLIHDASRDSLTGLPNRELFVERLDVLFNLLSEERNINLKIFYIAIMYQKNLHVIPSPNVKESLTVTLVKRLRSHLGRSDTLARLGEDHFAILTTSKMQIVDPYRFAGELQRSIRTPIRIDGRDFVSSGAIGIAITNNEVNEYCKETFLKDAEIAMLHAKQESGEQVAFFRPDMRGKSNGKINLADEFQFALRNKRLEVLFQPIINLKNEELAGFETIVRWRHQKLGVLGQRELSRLADEKDLTFEFSAYLIKTAVDQVAKWEKEFPCTISPLFISVNIESSKLLCKYLVHEIRRIIGRDLIHEGVLRLEINEALLMENPERAIETLEALNQSGIRVVMDNFGCGHSCIPYLQRFSVDIIKIDCDLITSCSGLKIAGDIVRSIIALTHQLGKQVAAQGVDILEDANFLRSVRCEYAQGSYYGESMTATDVLSILKTIRKAEQKIYKRALDEESVPKEKNEISKYPKQNNILHEEGELDCELSVQSSDEMSYTNHTRSALSTKKCYDTINWYTEHGVQRSESIQLNNDDEIQPNENSSSVEKHKITEDIDSTNKSCFLPHMVDQTSEPDGDRICVSTFTKQKKSDETSSNLDRVGEDISLLSEKFKQIPNGFGNCNIFSDEKIDLHNKNGSDVQISSLSKLPPDLAASLGQLAGFSDEQIEEITKSSRTVKKNR